MTARASFRSQLLIGSVLWTVGVLLVVSVLGLVFLGHNPRPHRIVLGWLVATPMALVVLVGLGSMVAGVLRIGRSLSAVDGLRGRLAALHQGTHDTIVGDYPAEVQPLVDDLNALLVEREQRVARAVARAGDLAHGLKTPLAVLSRDAELIAARGDAELASTLSAQIERMRRQIDYHLAHARSSAVASPSAVRAPIVPCVDGLFRTLERLHADRGLTLANLLKSDHAVRCAREDLDEILGNLLDNACKWCQGRVEVGARDEGAFVAITVDDDGAGIDPAVKSAVMRRGVRADEAVPGHGLGLAIARELAESYGGSIELSSSLLGGLRVTLRLPIAT